MYSMTGFGHAQRSLEKMDIDVHIKTTNGRYLDIDVRLPRELILLETEIRSLLRSHLSRGRGETRVSVTLKSSNQYEVDEILARNYIAMAKEISASGAVGELDVATLLHFPGVVKARESRYSSPEISRSVLDVFQEALRHLLQLRQAEGEALRADLQNRIEALEQFVEQIGQQAERVEGHYRDRLKRRLRELSKEQAVDENRLAQELLFYVERCDISEELSRLRSHIEQFRNFLKPSDHGGVGKSLDFLCQEMNREMNTALSKATLPELSRIGIAGKAEIEKIREQVQNVE